MKNFYKIKFNLVGMLALVAGLLMQNKVYSQSTLVAGDILFTGYNTIPAPQDNADIISFVLLRDISNNTVINFTDRGYFGNNIWQAVTSTEGTIRWTSGSFLPMGTEVQITALSAQARIPGGSLTPNGTVVKTEHYSSTYNNASTGMLLASTGDQIIAFQGGTSPSDSGVVFIAGLHYTQCGSGGVNTNDNWDTAACFDSPTKSMMPPGLQNGFSAFKTTIPGGTTNNYSGLFQCTGAPYANAAAIRNAVMNRNNWLFSNEGTGLSQPSGCNFVATCQAPSITANPVNRTICSGSNTTFSVTATGTNLTYQWQVNTGGGYLNISNGGFYSGVATATLTVSGANATIHGAVYRCVITGTCGNTTSNGVSLTVTTLNLSTSKTNVSCNGGNTGSAQVSVSGGSGFYNYSWSPSGGSGSSASSLAAGTYTVTVTDSNGCQNTASVIITQPAATLSGTTLVTNIACNGASTGAINLTPTGGTGPYTFVWNNGATTEDRVGLSAGTYSVTITDNNGCTGTVNNIVVTQPATLTATQSQTNVSCNSGSNGTATVVASGGAGGYTYQWSNGATTQTVTGLSVGNYTVTVTDVYGCQIQKTFTITQPTALTAIQSQNNVSCNSGSNGTATIVASGGAGGYTYEWSHGPTTQTVTGLAAGAYSVTVTDANTCQIQRSFTITQPTTLTASTSQTNIACNGGSTGVAAVSPSGGTPGYTYQWSHGPTTQIVTGLAAGVYSVTVTDANACQIQKSFTISQPTALSVSTTSITNASCDGGNSGAITVAASGGTGPYMYSWSPSGGTAATASGLAPGNYTVTVTDGNLCTATQSFEITGGTNPDIAIDQTATICETQGNSLLAPTSAAFHFEGFKGVFASTKWTATTSLGANGLPNTNGSITFNPDGTSIQMISSDGFNVYGYNQIGITIPKASTLSFNWSYQTVDDGVEFDYPRILVNEQEYSFQGFGTALSQAGTHSIYVNAGDVIIIRMVSQDSYNGPATVNITNFVVSNGISYDYQWTASEGGVINGDGDELELTVGTAGVYTLTATNDEGCTTSKSVTVSLTPNAPPTAEMYQPIADGEIWTLADLTVSGTNLTWYTDEALTTSVPDTTEVVVGATYYATQTVNGCESSAIAIVTDCEKPVVTLDETASFCEGSNLTLTPEVSELVNYTYQWTASEGGIINGDANELALTVDTAGTYTLTTTTEEGCSSVHAVVVTEINTDTPAGDAVQTLNTGQTLADVVVTGTNLKWYSDAGLTTEIPSTTEFVSGTTYYVTQTPGNCEGDALAVTLYAAALGGDCASFTVWNGTSWSHGVPNITYKAIINGDLEVSTELIACELEITANGSITILENSSLGVIGKITNNATVTDFVVHNTGTVIQLEDVQNEGPLTVHVTSYPLYRQDYTLWSSPVKEQNLRIFSPQTLYNRFSSYDTTLGTVGEYVQEIFTTEDVLTKTFTTAKGYLIRTPNNWTEYVNETIPGIPYQGEFKGVPQNGNISIPLTTGNGGLNLVGNPYPSALSIPALFNGNETIDRTIYFWRKRNVDAGSGYAVYNEMGFSSPHPGLSTMGETLETTPQISPGQGFFVKSNGATQLNFNNLMRNFQSNGVFFRSAPIEKHRIWLSLSNSNSLIGQTLIGYTPAASSAVDNGFDSAYFNDSPIALTSLIGGNEYSIQSLGMPFDASTTVPLGFKTNVAGSYTIALTQFDGLFAENQNVYLRDNLNGNVQNLKVAPYTFTATEGIANARFEVLYQTTLGTELPVDAVNKVMVYKQDKDIHINAMDLLIQKVALYDVSGRLITELVDVNQSTAVLNNLSIANQVVLVKITTVDHKIVTKKIVY